MKPIIVTERLLLREAVLDDDEFVLGLVNESGWIRYIGDRHVHDLEDARHYIRSRILDHYREHGFGIWVVERKDEAGAIGVCGLIQRDSLPDVDLGFAFAESHWGRGYARESARAAVVYARDTLHLRRLIAITDSENQASRRIIESLGMNLEGEVPREEDGKPVLLYACSLDDLLPREPSGVTT